MAEPADQDKTALLVVIADIDASIEDRVHAAEKLAALGDPRLDARRLVTVPAGVVHHQSARGSKVELRAVEAFRIAEHLVTVHEYGELIDDGGYDDPGLWSPEGWRWRLDHDVEAPRFWDAPDEWEPYLIANRPVVGVSAFEAEAYAAYRACRLPTELEWERACRGDDDRAHPWGDSWHDDRCGHRGHGPRCTLPVGIFPRGLSPWGIHDLVGNVWQWTSDARGELRIVCGGGWNNLPWSIGSAGRNAFQPHARFSNLGLRLSNDG